MKKVCNDQMNAYLCAQFTTLKEAHTWLSHWANNDHQVIKCGIYKGMIFSGNCMIRHISTVLGHEVDNAFKSDHYWDLRDYYETHVT